MFEKLANYYWNNRRALRFVWKPLGYIELAGYTIRRAIIRHPTATAILLLIALAGYFYNYPRAFFPETCRRLDMAEGGYTVTSISRDCLKGSVIAFTWRERGDSVADGVTDNRSLANAPVVFQSLQAVLGARHVWSERYLHSGGKQIPVKQVVSHDWAVSSHFQTEGVDADCREKEAATGFVLRTSRRSLSRKCDAAPASRDAECRWGFYEMFIPAISNRWCESRHFLDYGTRRIVLTDSVNACLREVLEDGTVLPGWRVFGRIGSIWCD